MATNLANFLKIFNGPSHLAAFRQNLRMLDHPHLVRLYEVNEDAEANADFPRFGFVVFFQSDVGSMV